MNDKTKEIRSVGLTWAPEPGKDPVLKDVSLTLEEGHIYGIIGPNGAGKSSFLKHVLAFLKAKRKSCMLVGEKPVEMYSRRELARLLSFVPQKTDIDTDFTAEEIVKTGRTPYQKRWQPESEEDKRAVERALERTGSKALADRPFSRLSGGEAQKIVIARAVAQAAPWMILDEPISSLDIRNQIEILETLQKLNREEGVSVLMVLHDVNLAGVYCDRLIMLKNGKVLFCGDPREVLTKEHLKELYEIDFTCLSGDDGRQYYLASQPPSTASVKPLT